MTDTELQSLKIVGYARKSKIEKKKNKEEEKLILSIEDQLKWFDKYLPEHSLSFHRAYYQNPMWENKTAYHPGREEFNKMVAMIKAGIYDSIITYHISRLSR